LLAFWPYLAAAAASPPVAALLWQVGGYDLVICFAGGGGDAGVGGLIGRGDTLYYRKNIKYMRTRPDL